MYSYTPSARARWPATAKRFVSAAIASTRSLRPSCHLAICPTAAGLRTETHLFQESPRQELNLSPRKPSTDRPTDRSTDWATMAACLSSFVLRSASIYRLCTLLHATNSASARRPRFDSGRATLFLLIAVVIAFTLTILFTHFIIYKYLYFYARPLRLIVYSTDTCDPPLLLHLLLFLSIQSFSPFTVSLITLTLLLPPASHPVFELRCNPEDDKMIIYRREAGEVLSANKNAHRPFWFWYMPFNNLIQYYSTASSKIRG